MKPDICGCAGPHQAPEPMKRACSPAFRLPCGLGTCIEPHRRAAASAVLRRAGEARTTNGSWSLFKAGAVVKPPVRRDIPVKDKIAPIPGLLDVVRPFEVDGGRQIAQAERGPRNGQFQFIPGRLILDLDRSPPLISLAPVRFD